MYSHVCGRATNAGCSAGKREINEGSQFTLARNGNNVVTDEYGFYAGGDQPMSLRLPSGRTGVFITDPQLRGTVRAAPIRVSRGGLRPPQNLRACIGTS